MSQLHDSMMNPRVEELLDRAGSKFRLVTLGAMRARQINAYFGQLGEGLGAMIPPQVTSVARKPLSIAFEEIGADKIVAEPIDEAAAAAAEAAAAEASPLVADIAAGPVAAETHLPLSLCCDPTMFVRGARLQIVRR